MVLIFTVCIAAGTFGGGAIPVLFVGYELGDFIVRRIILGFVIGCITFLMTGLSLMLIEEKLIPLIGRIREKYKEEASIQKKKVLDEVIDEEILK
jgi:hypothetical protein